MGVVFAQPEGFSQAISYGYGALQQEMADRDFALRARAHMGGGGGGGTQVQMYNPGGGNVQGMGGHGGGTDYESLVNSTLAIRQGELSQAESIRLQRDKNSLAQLDQAYDNGNGTLDRETYQNARIRLLTGIDPYERRQAAAHVQMMEQQNLQVMDQRAKMTAWDNMDDAARARNIQNRLVTLPSGHVVSTTRDGEIHALISDPNSGQQHILDQFRGQERHVSDQVQRMTPQELTAETERLGAVFRDPTTGAMRNIADRRELEVHRLRQMNNGAGTVQEIEARQATNRILGTVSRQMDQEAGRPNPPAWARDPVLRQDEQWTREQAALRANPTTAKTAAPAPRSIPEGTPLTTLPDRQRRGLEGLNQALDRTNDSEQRVRLFRAIQLFRRYGDTDAMPPSLQAFVLQTAAQPAPQRPAPAPAAPEPQPQGVRGAFDAGRVQRQLQEGAAPVAAMRDSPLLTELAALVENGRGDATMSRPEATTRRAALRNLIMSGGTRAQLREALNRLPEADRERFRSLVER